MKRDPIPTYGKHRFSPSADERAVIRRRTIGFLTYGTHLPIEHILGEAYLQGMRDALECMEPARSASSPA